MPTQKKPTTKSTKKPTTTTKRTKPVKLVKVNGPDTPKRRIKAPTYKSFRMSPRIKSVAGNVPSSISIFKDARKLLFSRWRLFAGIVLVYLVLTILLVKGLSGSLDLAGTKASLQGAFHGNWSQIFTGFTLFGVLLGSSSSASSDVAGVYQTILLTITSLVLIWALRQTHAGTKVGIKESYYKALYPLIPFVLVLIVIGIQLLPVAFAGFLYGVMFGTGLAVTAIEKGLWIILIALLILWSIYMITSSIFALYIVTLPDVKPFQALRSARELVLHRRWSVMRKFLFLPFILILLAAVIMVPVIIFVTPIAEFLFFVLTMLSLAVVHAYMYSLYRKLI